MDGIRREQFEALIQQTKVLKIRRCIESSHGY